MCFWKAHEGKMPPEYEYALDRGRRVLLGLTADETAEFECLDAQIPYDAKPVWPDTANSRIEDRWLEIYTKYERARQASDRHFGGRMREQAPLPMTADTPR
jgi:hypothetical protein